jgi:ATP-dependent DNA ligase
MTFLFPPRPEKAIDPSLIPYFEGKGWICQKKMNGTCSLAFVDPMGQVTFKTRHNENHKAWTPTSEAIKFFSGFRDSIFVFELLHSKGGDVRDTIYIFDLLKYLGKDLVGTQLVERLALLSKIEPFSPRITIAPVYTVGLLSLYNSLSDPLDEGVVLKNPVALLKNCYRDGLNADWQVKCRKPTKNYRH